MRTSKHSYIHNPTYIHTHQYIRTWGDRLCMHPSIQEYRSGCVNVGTDWLARTTLMKAPLISFLAGGGGGVNTPGGVSAVPSAVRSRLSCVSVSSLFSSRVF